MEKSSVKKITPVFSDERGTIADVYDGESIRHIGFITSKAGSVRGNHYHKKATQYTYILKGKVRWYTKDTRDPASEVVVRELGPGDLAADLPEIAHAMAALEDAEFLFFTDEVRTDDGYEKDTVRIKITP